MKLHEKTLSDLDSRKLIADVIQIAQWKLWNDKNGDRKAQKLIDEIHDGKYGSCEGLWVQVERALNEDINWQIAKIKNCKNVVTVHGVHGCTCGEYYNGKIQRCKQCQDRMKDFEIKESDLV